MIVRTYKFTDYADFEQQKANLAGVANCIELGIKYDTEYNEDGEVVDSTALSGYHVDVIWESSADASIDSNMVWADSPDAHHSHALEQEYRTAYEAQL